MNNYNLGTRVFYGLLALSGIAYGITAFVLASYQGQMLKFVLVWSSIIVLVNIVSSHITTIHALSVTKFYFQLGFNVGMINLMLIIFAVTVSYSNSQLTSIAVLAILHAFFHILNATFLLKYKDEIIMNHEPNDTKTTHISNSTEEA